VEMVFFKKSF